MRDKDDNIDRGVHREQTAHSENADGIHASRDNAEHGRKHLRFERTHHQWRSDLAGFAALHRLRLLRDITKSCEFY
jgi:hypothetical protein